MNGLWVLAQMGNEHQGWLTSKLLGVTLTSAEWVLWLLVVMSIGSIAVMIERAVYFSSRGLQNSEDLARQLAHGELTAVQQAVAGKQGMEATMLREAIAASKNGPDSVEETIASVVAKERPRYERFLSFLGTLGSNAPFIGLFGTVLGIIKAFNDLGSMGKGASVQATVMAGISEALVATAVGLFVAIPAVIAYNLFSRNLKTITARTQSLGHALVGHLRAVPPADGSR